jgi:5-methylcytosine-specific restriction endonuclease McrA
VSRALVLNASFEPLCVVSGRRALVLLLNQKAEMVHEGDEVFHSERAAFVIPSVVRLTHYVKVPYRAGIAVNRQAVFIRDGGRCQYCDATAESIDHVVPRSRGGMHTWENVVAACRPCNSRKRDRLLEETSFVLRTRPKAPTQQMWMYALSPRPEWATYLGVKLPVAAPGLSRPPELSASA